MQTTSSKPKRRTDDEIVVFSIVRDSECSRCGTSLWKGAFLRMDQHQPLCLECAGLDHLEFLASGDAALTRRARKYSPSCAVVVRFSRSRGRYERQGLLLESSAIDRAEEECAADADQRRVARERSAESRARAETRYVQAFADEILDRYPGCPPEEARKIASHGCAKYSGRIGRSADAKEFVPETIDLAVRAYVRHVHTNYDDLLSRGTERSEARMTVGSSLDRIMRRWQNA